MTNRSIIVATSAGFLLAVAAFWGYSMRLAEHKTKALLDYETIDVTQTLDGCRDFSLQVSAQAVISRLGTAAAVGADRLRAMADELIVDEINVVGSDGRVLGSTQAQAVGSSMLKTQESAAFMVLTNASVRIYSQPTRTNVDDPTIRRKYLGFAFPDGSGFVQVGADEKKIFSNFESIFQNVLRDWQVGEDGYYLFFSRQTGRLVNEPAGHPELNGMDVAGVRIGGRPMDAKRLNALADRGYLSASIRGERVDCVVLEMQDFAVLTVVPRSEFYGSAYAQFVLVAILLFALSAVFLKVVLRMRRDAETMARLRREEDAQREKDMAMAQSIQRHALPCEFPPYPELAPIIDLYAIMRAAKEVGGDFYDFGYIGGNRFCLLIADVSGKGVPGAMFMMRAKSTLKSLIVAGRPLAETVSEANGRLCEGNSDGLFVTAWIGIVDLSNGEVEYVNAGHNPPLLKRADGTVRWVEDDPDLPLAAMDGVAYEVRRMKLGIGDMLVLYTDGVTEASDGHGGFSGEGRLAAAVRAASGDAQSMCDAIRVSVDAFAGTAPQADDITVLSFGFNGARHVFPASEEGVRRCAAFVRGFDLGPDAAVVVDEIVSNVVRCSGTSEFAVEVRCDGTLVFTDDGVAFDPLQRDAPDVEAGIDERKAGGLGIFLVRQLAREVKYERRDGRNVLTVTLG